MAIELAYFLGAGASKAFYPELPLASELTLGYLLTPHGLQTNLDEAIKMVEEYIGTQRWSKEKRLATFEQIYPELSVKLKPLYPRENLEICLFRKLKFEGGSPPIAIGPWLEENLNSGYPVLTTNYDTVVEWGVENCLELYALRSLRVDSLGASGSGLVDYGVPNDLCLPPTSEAEASPHPGDGIKRLLLLKLYGSVSWCRCPRCGKYLLETINEAVAEDVHMGLGTCGGCGGTRLNAVFVPLVGQKSPNDLALRAIWARAEQVLSESRHIVFAGFSLHPNDQGIRELLRRVFSEGQTRRVTVVLRESDPPEVTERYRKIYGDRVESYNLGWAQYLKDPMASCRIEKRPGRQTRDR
jgi:hypothetical protein